MNIPQFTAEASLYETSNSYRSLGQRGEPQRAGVITQLGGPNYKGFEGCKMDCMDQHPNWTRQRCERYCRDPFAGHNLSTSGSWFNDFLSSVGIDLWEGACGLLVGSVLHVDPKLCGWVADEMRRQS